MSTELITGRRDSAHVHSHDIGQLHRGIFGQGKYRLTDRSNCAVTVTPGSVQIADGGIIWNGRYIRNWKEDPYTYASPASTQTVGVYLHYTKDESGIEDCVFEVFVGSDTPDINENFSDLETDAYTLFYSFTHNADGTISNGSNHFPIIRPTEEIETKISDSYRRITLFSGTLSAGKSYAFNQNIQNFKELEIWAGRCMCRIPVSELSAIKESTGHHVFTCVGAGYSASDGPVSILRTLVTTLTNTSITNVKGLQNNLFVYNGTKAHTTSDNPNITKIIGVGIA